MLLIIKANINGNGTIADILIYENGKYKEISENITASGGTKVIEANSMMACPTTHISKKSRCEASADGFADCFCACE